LLNSGGVELLDGSDRLVNQLCGLTRRISRSGKDSIDHEIGGHDDLANAAMGAILAASEAKGIGPKITKTMVAKASRHRFVGVSRDNSMNRAPISGMRMRSGLSRRYPKAASW
jgi:hypothetical protein